MIGAGVIGLAVAAALSRQGCAALVLERRAGVGQGVSARNSEVIHAGLYYPPGSLKARTCVRGRELLYQRCQERGLPHLRTGKLVVAATPADLLSLEGLWSRGMENGAGGLEILSGDDLRRRERRVTGLGALWSPESGIVDAQALVSSYQAEAEAGGAQVVLRTEVVGLEWGRGAWTVHTRSAAGERFSLRTSIVVNAAGLDADRIAALAGLDVDALGWRIRPCKGDYFAVSPSLGTLTEHLVYPPPTAEGLGIHVTRDLGRRYRLGPDVEYVARPSYAVDPAKAQRFADAVRPFLPEIRAAHLMPDFAGVRPKLQGPGEPPRDFVIEETSEPDGPGLVHLVGIESPGLTAAGAIAERVAERLRGR